MKLSFFGSLTLNDFVTGQPKLSHYKPLERLNDKLVERTALCIAQGFFFCSDNAYSMLKSLGHNVSLPSPVLLC